MVVKTHTKTHSTTADVTFQYKQQNITANAAITLLLSCSTSHLLVGPIFHRLLKTKHSINSL